MKSRWRWITLAAVLTVGVATWHASLRVGTGPASGNSIEGTVADPPPHRDVVRLATFNIHGCKGSDGVRDIERVANCLEDLDFIGLNEVHGGGLLFPDNQARELAGRLGRAWLFAPASRRWHCREFGNGLISALPVGFWQRIPLQNTSDSGYRNGVLVGLEFRGTTIHALIAHLVHGDSEERAHQLETVIRLFLALETPAVLMGDLNSQPSDPQIRQLLQTPGVSDPVGQLLDPPPGGRIDWILVRGLRGVAAGVIDHGASDHPLYWVDLESPR